MPAFLVPLFNAIVWLVTVFIPSLWTFIVSIAGFVVTFFGLIKTFLQSRITKLGVVSLFISYIVGTITLYLFSMASIVVVFLHLYHLLSDLFNFLGLSLNANVGQSFLACSVKLLKCAGIWDSFVLFIKEFFSLFYGFIAWKLLTFIHAYVGRSLDLLWKIAMLL